MTMDASSSEVEYLSSTLLKSKTPITYYMLSRSLKIHQNSAKHILHEFYSSNKDKVLASFIISGKSNSGQLIKLCKDEKDLEADMKLFEAINTIHVYCLHAKGTQTTNEDVVIEELKYRVDHSKADDYFKTGMIKGPDLEIVDIQKPLPVVATKSTPSPAPSEEKAKPKSSGLSSGYVSRKAANTANRPAKRSSTDLISNFASRKSESSNKPSKRSSTDPSPTGYQYKSRKLEKQQPKERVVMSNADDQDDNDEVLSTKQEEKKPLSNLNNLFMDDFSDDSDHEQNKDTEEAEEPIVISEPEKESSTNTKKLVPDEPKQIPQAEPVKAKEDAVDNDGYLTSFKTNNPVKNTKSEKKKGQASLMNFFKPK